MRACILDKNTKKCINVIEINSLEDFRVNKAPIELAPQHDGEIGWIWTDEGWVDPTPQITVEEKAELFRKLRDRKLQRFIDSMNPVRWESMSEEQKQQWRDYRQDLLNVPQQAGFPDNIIWPTKPE